jgi:SM-20-related protein
MTTLDGAPHFDLYLQRAFIDEQTCKEIVAEMRSAQSAPAAVYGVGSSGSIEERVRKGMRHEPSRETVEYVLRRLWECKHEVEEHFGVSLNECEEPQFLRYRVGDFFVAHQDGNTGMLRLDQESRLVSVVIFLSQQSDDPDQGDYSGGSLVFHEWRPDRNQGQLSLAGEAGTLVAFRAETTHEVIPVTHGERYSIAGWYR